MHPPVYIATALIKWVITLNRLVDVWMLKARLGLSSFTPQCLAHTLWALPRLRVGRGSAASVPLQPEAELMEGLLMRCSQVKRSHQNKRERERGNPV